MNYLKTRILIVEDNLQDFIIFKELLSHIRDFFIQIEHADSLENALSKLETSAYDIVFLDLFLPDSYGQDTFSAVQKVTASPVVILSGLSDKKIALDIVKQGAQDYIVKGEFDSNLLEKAIVYSIERKKYQEILEESERRSRSIFESIGIAIAEYDYTELHKTIQKCKAEGMTLEAFLDDMDLEKVEEMRNQLGVLNMNPEALTLYSCKTKEDYQIARHSYFNSSYIAYYKEAMKAIWTGTNEMVYELAFASMTGKVVHTLKRWRFLGMQSGFYRLLISTEDVTRLKDNEEQIIRQSEVMEGVASAAAILLSEGDINLRMNRVLNIAGPSLGGICMCVYLFDFVDSGRIAYNRTHLWWEGDASQLPSASGVFSDPETILEVTKLERSVPVILNRESVQGELAKMLEAHKLKHAVITPFKTSVGRGCLTLGYTDLDHVPDFVYSGMMTLASSIGSALATANAQEELRKMNEELEQRVDDRTEKMRQAIQELESFSYSVSHDLRAPLRTISGFTGVLHEEYSEQLDNEGKHFLDNIRRGASEMSQLIDDLLNFSRMGRRQLQFEEIDMDTLARAVFDELRAQVPERNIKFVAKTLLPCKGDQSMVRQILVNFIWNAVKFTAREEEAVIEMTGKTLEPGWVEYCIKDNGVGFDMKYADKLFGVFQRLHPHEEFDGTGVGLAIIQRVVNRHGGEVRATGEENVGAKFCFSLPAGGAGA